jgi:hypothetical protein
VQNSIKNTWQQFRDQIKFFFAVFERHKLIFWDARTGQNERARVLNFLRKLFALIHQQQSVCDTLITPFMYKYLFSVFVHAFNTL